MPDVKDSVLAEPEANGLDQRLGAAGSKCRVDRRFGVFATELLPVESDLQRVCYSPGTEDTNALVDAVREGNDRAHNDEEDEGQRGLGP